MKKYFFILIISIFMTPVAQSQEYWYWQNPIPQGNELNGLWLFNNQTALAVGDVGTVIKTTDGGKHWTVAHYVADINSDLYTVFFIDQSTGWVAGDDGKILKTTNGGKNWFVQTIDNISSIRGLFFLDSQRGWAVGYKVNLDQAMGVILKTVTGGDTWTVEPKPNASRLYSIRFLNEKLGWATGSRYVVHPQNAEDLILRTEDGGQSWVPQYTRKTNQLYGACFIDSLHGWAVGTSMGSTGTIVHTKDSGITWVEQTNPSKNKELLWAIAFRDVNTGWAVGEQGTLIKTSDGGNNWVEESTHVERHLKAIQFTGSQVVVAVGNAGVIIKSENNGAMWQELSAGTSMWYFNGVDFTDPDTGWVVGPNKTILKSIDGGTNWAAQVSPGPENLLDICMVNNQMGWTVGEWGVILQTTDGGKNWNIQPSGTSDFLHACFFITDQLGWVCGGPVSDDSSIILHTSDGGKLWARQNCSANTSLKDIYFTSDRNGWTVGGSGSIFHTIDGGLNWSPVALGGAVIDSISSIFFLTDNIGWIGGTSILFTADGGKTWTEQLKLTQSDQVHDIYFIDRYIGWAVVEGVKGLLYKTMDGGLNWLRQYIGTENNLSAISIVNDQIAWIVGTYSAILKTDAVFVPVEFVSFNVSWLDGRVELVWATATESNNYGFEVQCKSPGNKMWHKVGFVEGHGTTTQTNYYSFVDRPQGRGKYSYRLKQIDLDGSFKYSPVREVTVPGKFALYQNYPNPFNPETTISFELPVSAPVKLEIFNMWGQKVAVVLNESKSAGLQQVTWDGKDEAGRKVGSGVYFYHIKIDNYMATKKLVLLR